jgi:hypothetical protein
VCGLQANGIQEGGKQVGVDVRQRSPDESTWIFCRRLLLRRRAVREQTPALLEDFMSTTVAPDRSPATSSRSASALNLVGGTWVEGRGNTSRDIYNPADAAEMLAPVREAAPEQVDEACAAAARAFPGWRATPAPDRAHVLFKFRELLETNFSDVAHSIVRENGKLLSAARCGAGLTSSNSPAAFPPS